MELSRYTLATSVLCGGQGRGNIRISESLLQSFFPLYCGEHQGSQTLLIFFISLQYISVLLLKLLLKFYSWFLDFLWLLALSFQNLLRDYLVWIFFGRLKISHASWREIILTATSVWLYIRWTIIVCYSHFYVHISILYFIYLLLINL